MKVQSKEPVQFTGRSAGLLDPIGVAPSVVYLFFRWLGGIM